MGSHFTLDEEAGGILRNHNARGELDRVGAYARVESLAIADRTG